MLDASVFPPGEGPPIPEPDWNGFRAWRCTNSLYLALLDGFPGRVQAMENAIDKGDYSAALLLWNGLRQLNAVSPELEAALMEAVDVYQLPGDLLWGFATHD